MRKLLQNGYPAGVVNYNINDVLNRQQNKPRYPTTTVPKKETILVLPYLGVQSKIVTKQLKTFINKFYGCIDLRVILQRALRTKSFFPYKDRINRSQMSKVVYKASCWDCQDFLRCDFRHSATLIPIKSECPLNNITWLYRGLKVSSSKLRVFVSAAFIMHADT